MNKRKFFASYGYGTGGGWWIILARTKEEIIEKFSELVVMDYEPKPPNMSDETYQYLCGKTNVHDIDDVPTGVLASFLRKSV